MSDVLTLLRPCAAAAAAAVAVVAVAAVAVAAAEDCPFAGYAASPRDATLRADSKTRPEFIVDETERRIGWSIAMLHIDDTEGKRE